MTAMTVKRGPVELAARRDVRALGDLAGIQRSLAETAYRLARTLDDGAGLATAAVARELRATLISLKEAGKGDAASARLLERLSAPLDDPEIPRTGDAGRAGGGGGQPVGDAVDAVAAARRRRRVGTGP
jgi:hypothetical protein